MSTRYCFFIMSALFISGCASTRIVEPNAPAAVFEKIKHDTRKRDAKMTLASGETLNARNIHVAQDSTAWTNSKTGKRETVPTAEVRKIVVKKSRALQGWIIGGLVGIPVGVMIAGSVKAESGPDSCQSGDFLQCTGSALGEGLGEAIGEVILKAVAFTGTVAVGSLTGLAIGASVGNKEIYQFTRPKEPSSTGKNK